MSSCHPLEKRTELESTALSKIKYKDKYSIFCLTCGNFSKKPDSKKNRKVKEHLPGKRKEKK